MGYWRSKVLPTMKKLLEKFPSKKSVSGEVCKPFDDSKEAINKEIEEKKIELGPKVVEIYETSSPEIKALVRNPDEADLKKHSAAVQKFLEDLVKIEFPGSKVASEVSSTLGAIGPVTFIFEKVSLFLPAEEKPREIEEVFVKSEEPPAKEEEIKTEETIIAEKKDKEIVEDKKKEQVITPPAPAPAVSPAAATAAAPVEAPKAAPAAAPAEAPKAAPVVAAEEKKPVVEEVKKEAVAVPAVTAVKAPENTTVKAPETSTVGTPVKAPVTPAAAPPKA